jgi:hypothetical protein
MANGRPTNGKTVGGDKPGIIGWGGYRPMPRLGEMPCTGDTPAGRCEAGQVRNVGVFAELTAATLTKLNAGLLQIVTTAPTAEGQRAAWLDESRKRLLQSALPVQVDLDPVSYLPIYRHTGTQETIGADGNVSTAGFAGEPGTGKPAWQRWALIGLGLLAIGSASFYAYKTGRK